ncbi:hypothetical protein GPALN_006679 [Globodera pallida]|nr:hypothetical protein GPALN_006679 [Globodera pallida]
MKDVEERGGRIWSTMNAKEGGPLQNWAVVMEKPERMDFGGVKSVKELNKQINQIEIPGWAIYGPGIVAHQRRKESSFEKKETPLNKTGPRELMDDLP